LIDQRNFALLPAKTRWENVNTIAMLAPSNFFIKSLTSSHASLENSIAHTSGPETNTHQKQDKMSWFGFGGSKDDKPSEEPNVNSQYFSILYDKL
jgi:hypothetical protein